MLLVVSCLSWAEGSIRWGKMDVKICLKLTSANETYRTPRHDCCTLCKRLWAWPTNAKHVTQCITVNCLICSSFSSFEDSEIPLVGTLISASVLTWEGVQAHGVLQQQPKDKACIQGHLLKGQNWMMQCSCLGLHHVLPFPANRRTSKAYTSICHAGVNSTSRSQPHWLHSSTKT